MDFWRGFITGMVSMYFIVASLNVFCAWLLWKVFPPGIPDGQLEATIRAVRTTERSRFRKEVAAFAKREWKDGSYDRSDAATDLLQLIDELPEDT
jgi:hypothetical protein